MRPKIFILLIPTLLLTLAHPAVAQWPTSIREYLYVANNDTLHEYLSQALPYPDGSTLVVYSRAYSGICYQIIDKYGQLHYADFQLAVPGFVSYYVNFLKVYADGEGGALICWKNHPTYLDTGVWAQRLDSLGNRLWGPMGKQVFPFSTYDYDACIDGQGGFFVAGNPTNMFEPPWIRINHFDAQGEPTWGDSGIVVCYTDYYQGIPRIAPDGHGGVWVVWEDNRPPYGGWGALFMQHFDAEGDRLLMEEGIFICQRVYFHEVLPDGQAGLFIHTNPNTADFNTVFRLGHYGEVIWNRTRYSWTYYAKMIPGEPGYFYFGWPRDQAMHAQRIDLDGNTYWPTFGSFEGTELAYLGEDWWLMSYNDPARENYFYREPYFYAIYEYYRSVPSMYLRKLFVQASDPAGSVMMGEDGSLIGVIYSEHSDLFCHLNVCPDDRHGAVAVFTFDGIDEPDVYAKRVNIDGTIGGPVYTPYDVTVSLTPYGAPIQIPASGGSFDYNISVNNNEPGPMSFDVWAMCFQPDSTWLGPLLGPVNVTFPGNWTVSRDRTQEFYYLGTPGTYTYYSYVGDYPFEIWDADSFQFEKLPDGEGPLVTELNNWGEALDTVKTQSATEAEELQLIFIQNTPNPFNETTRFKFILPQAAHVTLQLYDISGRLIEELLNQWINSGDYMVRFDGSNLASGVYFYKFSASDEVYTGKMVLLK